MSRERSDHRRHELMEGENRRGGEAGQDHDRLSPAGSQTDRLSGLEGDTVNHDSRIELGHDPTVEIALTLRGSAR